MNEPAPGAPDFAYRDGDLCAEEVRLAHAANIVGTPFYCYSSAHIARQYRRFAAAFADRDAAICYSVKANSSRAVITTLARLGSGADVVSEGEFRRALAAGIPGDRIVFSGIGKTETELAFALAHEVRQINVESLPELELLSRIASAQGRVAPIGIRVNPDVDAKTHAKITTGLKENKFGIDAADALAAFRRARGLPGLAPVGLAVHIGSQLTELAPFEAAFERAVALYRAVRADGVPLTRLDLGGGIGIRYRDETPPTIEAYAAMVKRLTEGLGASLSFEPGRYLVGNAGVLVTRVLYVKEGGSRRFVIVDAAMNDLIRPALYDAWHEVVPLKAPAASVPLAPADLVGPVCETGDSFALARPLPPLSGGDLIAILSAGAYGAVMSSGYNTRLPIPELLVRGTEFAVVRQRPSYEQVLAEDQLPPWLAER
ncbi:MAG TPA: diaminopimelate decarboxylase [Stellaceae bacterium]|nr:diaminopimelate decarboxylase [Stellaceae bacterium]